LFLRSVLVIIMNHIEFGIDELRATVCTLDHNLESFNQRFSALELLRIAACLRACEWDYMPDEWTEAQVKQALRGHVPHWATEDEPCKPLKNIRESHPHLWRR
jgi:hypothetical protein